MERVSQPGFLAERYPVEPLLRRLREARVDPAGAALGALGLLVVALLGLELATGALLALYYRPEREGARASVQFVVTRVEYGELVRSLHGYGAHALLLALLALLGGVLAAARHRKPHEVAWSALVLVWFAAVAQAFTGSLLPWSARSALDAAVASGAVERVPVAGSALRALVFGPAGGTELVRLYGLHVGALPALGTLCLLALCLHVGGRLVGEGTAEAERVWPTLALRGAALGCFAFAVLLALASRRPLPLGAAPSLGAAASQAVAPSWFLAPLDLLLRRAPARVLGLPGATVVVVLCLLGVLGALALPAIDRRGGRLGQVLGLAVLALSLGVMGLAILR
ncbi:MAG: cytochrome b N-terminal domain-containing protein [Deltaproteobacteria bacterium]|nr:cytochrome b N-terminal domain-containing protein [Deltaproteobacteria bacterium]